MVEPTMHERRDVDLKLIAITVGVLTGSALVIHVALWALLMGFERFGGTAGQLPSEPRPPAHLHQRQETRAIEQAALKRLHSAGPGATPGRVRIPIEQAIDRIVQQGWRPAKPSPSPTGGRP